MKTEAIFGGILLVLVVGVALYAVASTTLPGGSRGGAKPPVEQVSVSDSRLTPKLSTATGQDLICECYDAAFALSGKVDVLSPEYRTGFQQCRARGGVDAGDAWTAGWNARLSGRPYEASCRAYKRRS